MGGFGSTRWNYHQQRPVAEYSLPFSISDIRQPIYDAQHAGAAAGRLQWGSRAAVAYRIEADATQGTITLSYIVDEQQATDRIRLITSVQGGACVGRVRWWFACPSCQRRSGTLYNPHRVWRCKHCHRITFLSSNRSDKRVSALLKQGLPTPNEVATLPISKLLLLLKALERIEQ